MSYPISYNSYSPYLFSSNNTNRPWPGSAPMPQPQPQPPQQGPYPPHIQQYQYLLNQNQYNVLQNQALPQPAFQGYNAYPGSRGYNPFVIGHVDDYYSWNRQAMGAFNRYNVFHFAPVIISGNDIAVIEQPENNGKGSGTKKPKDKDKPKAKTSGSGSNNNNQQPAVSGMFFNKRAFLGG